MGYGLFSPLNLDLFFEIASREHKKLMTARFILATLKVIPWESWPKIISNHHPLRIHSLQFTLLEVQPTLNKFDIAVHIFVKVIFPMAQTVDYEPHARDGGFLFVYIGSDT